MSSNEVLTAEKDSEVRPYRLLATALNDSMDLFKKRVMKFHRFYHLILLINFYMSIFDVISLIFVYFR